jgi:hypothetical protein
MVVNETIGSRSDTVMWPKFGTIGSDMLRHSSHILIIYSAFIGVSIIGHVICYKQTLSRTYIYLTLSSSVLFTQYVLAIKGINAAHLIIIANLFTVMANLGLFVTWAQTMKKIY